METWQCAEAATRWQASPRECSWGWGTLGQVLVSAVFTKGAFRRVKNSPVNAESTCQCGVKNPPVNSGDAGSIPGSGGPPGEEMATHSSVLAWEILWTRESGRLQSAAAAAKSLQSCPSLCEPTDGSPPGSPVPGILQARTLERVAVSFSNASK